MSAAGLAVTSRRRVALVSHDGRRSVWLLVHDPARVTPESLTLEAISVQAALRPIAALVSVFGALELRTPGAQPRIVEQASNVEA